MKHPYTGKVKAVHAGFSWTSLFFGAFPALFRGDFANFFLCWGIAILGAMIIAVAAPTFAFLWGFVFQVAWAFLYNNMHEARLLNAGYVLMTL
jgi:hypothetical protein